MMHETYETFEAVKNRLDEIVDTVSDNHIPLDDALALYEEAVALGLRAGDLLEADIDAHRACEATREVDEGMTASQEDSAMGTLSDDAVHQPAGNETNTPATV